MSYGHQTRIVAATVQQPDNGTLIVTYHGGHDEDQVQGMNVTITDSSGQVQTKMVGRKNPTHALLPVGEIVTFSGKFSGNDHAVATVHFTDGSTQIIMDTSV